MLYHVYYIMYVILFYVYYIVQQKLSSIKVLTLNSKMKTLHRRTIFVNSMHCE